MTASVSVKEPVELGISVFSARTVIIIPVEVTGVQKSLTQLHHKTRKGIDTDVYKTVTSIDKQLYSVFMYTM